jgi:hypothetical protein
MVSASKNKLDLNEVRQRAAQIRSHWSLLERHRRMGLPPDVPARLRDFIVGGRQPAWAIAKRWDE